MGSRVPLICIVILFNICVFLCTTISFDELYNKSDMAKLKQSMVELVRKRDYKTLNKLLRRNYFVSKFDSRELNEAIPLENKRFPKRDGKLCNVKKYNTYVEVSNGIVAG